MVLALYPQYSCSTVAAVWDELARILATRRRIPGVTFIRDYADNELYIKALASSAARRLKKLTASRICCCCPITAFRSVSLTKGMIIRSAVAIPRVSWCPRSACCRRRRVMMTFQSRFGREPWLTPYTDETLKMLGEKGVKHIQVMSPGSRPIAWKRWRGSRCKTGEFFLEAGGEVRVHSGT